MAWFHQYQYVEIIDPLYPQLRHKCLPIIRYELDFSDTKILAVEAGVGHGSAFWFKRSQFIFYKTGKDFSIVPEQRRNVSIFNRLLKSLNLRRF